MNDRPLQKQILELCDAAMARPASERDVYLASACGDDATLRAAVDALLLAITQSDAFLVNDDDPDYRAGDTIGDYRIVSELGQGGMGTIYLADREATGFTQRVALKVMRTYLRSAQMTARFDEERRILAHLNHPFIARLMDGGTTDSGLPFLVMELVEGIPIDEYCDARRLDVHARLQLVQQVAMAIQSAHQNLVVHRDLKPGNILITDDGIPKLLDFGIARLVDADAAVRPRNAATDSARALTPDYASPEQVAGHTMTTASDLYSLGVLTYYLLIGTTPPARNPPTTPTWLPSEHVTALRDDATMHAAAHCRATTPTRLARTLRGDLDAILEKAMCPDPAGRYASAVVFADELQRWRQRKPVAAGGDSLSYHLGKFISRYRLGVTAGGAVAVALIVALGIALWQAHVARQRFDDLRTFTETMIYDLHDAIADLPGATPARQLLTREALHYLDRMAQDAAGDRALQRDLSMAYKRLGDALGNPSNANLGDVDGAYTSYSKALAIAQRLLEDADADPQTARFVAIVHEKLADVSAWKRDMDSALEHSQRALTHFENIAQRDPDSEEAQLSVAISHVKRGDLLGHPDFPNVGRLADAGAQYEQALAILTPVAQAAGSSVGARRYLALIHERLGSILLASNDDGAALKHLQLSLALRERLAAQRTAHADSRRDVAIAMEKIADFELARGNTDVALSHYEKALVFYRELAEADPTNVNATRTLAIGLANLGDALVIGNDPARASDLFTEALELRRALVAGNPADQRLAEELAALLDRATMTKALPDDR